MTIMNGRRVENKLLLNCLQRTVYKTVIMEAFTCSVFICVCIYVEKTTHILNLYSEMYA